MQNNLKQDIGATSMVLLILLLSQNLLQLPFLMLRSGMFWLLGYGFSPFVSQLVQALVYSGTMLVAIFFGVWITRSNREFLFPLSTPRRDYLAPALGAGLGAGMVGNVIATLLTVLLALGGVQVVDNVPSFSGGAATTLLTFFTVAALPAVLEELLFRGVLLQPLRRYGDRVAILLSALLFALCHPSLPQAVNAFLMGLCFGVFAVRSGSLVIPMLIHLVYNAAACLVTLLSNRLPFAFAAGISWLLIFSLLVVGIYSVRLLRRRFGSVWWVSPGATVPMRGREVVCAAFCSVPFLLMLLINLSTIFRNLYIY